MTRRERLEAKIAKREEWAEGSRAKSDVAMRRFHSIADGIPLGQPILVGHHSEKRHRRDLARIDSALHAAIESSNMAQHHEAKAEGLAHQLATSIFSDDPDATDQLAEKVRRLEARRDRMKEVNAAWRKAGKPDAGNAEGWAKIADALGVTVEALTEARKNMVYSWQKVPYPTYSLTNIGATIRNAKQRAEQITKQAARFEAAAASPTGVLIEGTGEYVRITFPEKPERETLDALRAAGFWWGKGSWSGQRAKIPACIPQDPATATSEPTRCGCPTNAPEADPSAYACPCGSHCAECAKA